VAQTVARKHPLAARAIVSLLATLLAVGGSMVAYTIAKELGLHQLASGIAYMLPLTCAWVATALTQHLMRKT
jgi:hypothetical protein